MNIAYTETYLEWRKKCDVYFTSRYLTDHPEEITQMADGFSVRSRFYSGEKDGFPCTMSENELLNSSGEVIYTWRNLDNGRGFVSLFKHSNDRHYLIFRTELYGYSILEIESGRDFCYIPSQSFPQNTEDFHETFIWVDASYNSKNSLLAVGGCFWAYPESVLILDFTDPFRERPSEKWLDLHTVLDPDYDIYCHIEFDHWDENGDLFVRVNLIETDKDEYMRLSVDKLKNWLSDR